MKKDNEYQIVIAGAGNIGRALMNYERFREDNIRIVAAFDIDPTKIGDKLRVPVYPLTEMEEYIRKNKIPLGIIAVPDVAAQSIFDLMIRAGIKGILNFTTIRFKGAEDVTISNVYLQFELENIIYNLK